MKRRVLRRHPFFDVTLDRFHDDDCVIHHQPDRQHQSEERERVDREAEQREQHKCADQRNRNRQQRNQRRPPALQEDEYDDDDQRERLEERLDDLAESLP